MLNSATVITAHSPDARGFRRFFRFFPRISRGHLWVYGVSGKRGVGTPQRQRTFPVEVSRPGLFLAEHFWFNSPPLATDGRKSIRAGRMAKDGSLVSLAVAGAGQSVGRQSRGTTGSGQHRRPWGAVRAGPWVSRGGAWLATGAATRSACRDPTGDAPGPTVRGGAATPVAIPRPAGRDPRCGKRCRQPGTRRDHAGLALGRGEYDPRRFGKPPSDPWPSCPAQRSQDSSSA